MNGDRGRGGEGRLAKAAAVARHANVAAEQRLGRGGTEADHDVRANNIQLRIEPRTAGLDLLGIGTLVQATLAAPLPPLEVLDDVGDVDVAALDPRLLQGLRQHLTRGPDERLARAVLAIPRLLADEHHARPSRTRSEYRLGPR